MHDPLLGKDPSLRYDSPAATMIPDVLLVVLLLAGARPPQPAAATATARATAQPASHPRPGPGTARASAQVGVEMRRDRYDCRFENPSRFNTTDLVPHFFEQRHVADNVWLVGRVRFGAVGLLLETEVGLTPSSAGHGRDHDTFYQPDGNVIVYGTAAGTATRSWQVVQHVGLGSWHGTRLRVGYSYRRDRAVYHPSESTTSQTKPPSFTSVWNTDRETTIAEIHEVRFGAERALVATHGWRLQVSSDVAPTTLARLSTILPDKYEDPVVFVAKGLSLNAGLRLATRVGAMEVGASVSYARTWSYSGKNGFHRSGIGVSLDIGAPKR
jgi:hypothetical protein